MRAPRGAAPGGGAAGREGEHLDALQRMRTLESYYRWAFDLLAADVGRRVLDAGCGIGSFAALVADRAEAVCGVDTSAENLAVARERFAGRSHVEFVQLDLEDCAGVRALASRRFDTVSCLDVLEHVRDDAALLEAFRDVVQPGGRLLLKVPAGPWMYGSVDEASGHHRRYGLAELRSRCEAAGWDVVRARPMNIAGVLPYWLKSRVLKRRANFSRTFSPRQLGLIRAAIPLLRAVDRIVGPPVGQSLVLVAKRR